MTKDEEMSGFGTNEDHQVCELEVRIAISRGVLICLQSISKSSTSHFFNSLEWPYSHIA